MALHKFIIKETRPYTDIDWWFQTETANDEALTPIERARHYNINLDHWPTMTDTVDPALDTFSSKVNGLIYQIEVIYSDDDPIVFFSENTPEYTARLQYCESQGITVETSTEDITAPVGTP